MTHPDIEPKGPTTRIMGILNVTGDSFYDGGRYLEPQQAKDQALRLIREGADILDIGAESSRPGSLPVAPDEEIRRLFPLLEALSLMTGITLSIDTSRSQVAREVLAFPGVRMINDIYALRRDPSLASLLADAKVDVVLMHMQGTPETMQVQPAYDQVVDEVLAFLEERVAFAVAEGITEEHIILDPGIGFGKTLEHNLCLLAGIERLQALGFPLLVGPSRKHFIGQLTGRPVEDRLAGTAAVAAYLVARQVAMIRVHDVQAMRDVRAVTAALYRPMALVHP